MCLPAMHGEYFCSIIRVNDLGSCSWEMGYGYLRPPRFSTGSQWSCASMIWLFDARLLHLERGVFYSSLTWHAQRRH